MRTTFADRLHSLCVEEIQRAYGCPDASAAMVTELSGALASAIALLMAGKPEPCATAARQVVEELPRIVQAKAAGVREGLAEMEASA